MTLDRYVNCPAIAGPCRFHDEPIRLLDASPPQTIHGREEWPEDGTFLYLACPECRHVSAHCHAYDAGFPESAHTLEKAWLRISFLCATQNCNTPKEFHVLMGTTVTQTTESELRAKLKAGYWTGVSPCDHPIYTNDAQNYVFEWVRGAIKGYNPRHPRWSDLRRTAKK